MAKIRWTEEAYRWLKDIYDYIALDNLEAAQKVVYSICQKVQLLDQFPEAGYKYQNEPEAEIRILLYGHYRIAYLLKDKNKNKPSGSIQIDILGVFHSALDIDKYLF